MDASEPGVREDVAAPPSGRLSSPTFWSEHAALLLTLGYLLLIVIGVMYEVFLFLHFNVNVLYYAEATDFIMVPFREPLVMLVCLAPIPLWIEYLRLTRWLDTSLKRGIARTMPRWISALEKKQPTAAARRTMLVSSVLGIVLWSIAFTARYARHVRDEIRDGRRQIVNVELAGEPIRSVEGTVIGTTAQYVFLYEHPAKETRIIPAENVGSIRVADRRRRDEPPHEKKQAATPATGTTTSSTPPVAPPPRP